VLLAKALRSSTFKFALVSIAVFGAVVIALFGYVYWSTAAYVLGQTDSSIAAERGSLHRAYDSSGHGGLVAAFICSPTLPIPSLPAILANGPRC
jgi:hypothetical protein